MCYKFIMHFSQIIEIRMANFVIKIFSSYNYLKDVFLRQHWINYFSVTVDKLFNRDQGGNCAYVNDA